MQDGTLERIGEIIDELTKDLVDQLDVEQAAHDDTRRAYNVSVTRRDKAESLIGRVRDVLAHSEMGRMSEQDAMAQIRGLLHG